MKRGQARPAGVTQDAAVGLATFVAASGIANFGAGVVGAWLFQCGALRDGDTRGGVSLIPAVGTPDRWQARLRAAARAA